MSVFLLLINSIIIWKKNDIYHDDFIHFFTKHRVDRISDAALTHTIMHLRQTTFFKKLGVDFLLIKRFEEADHNRDDLGFSY